MEDFLAGAVKYVKKECREELSAFGRELRDVKTPFAKFTTHELEEKYGSCWEDAASREVEQPFWALCHKREFYDKEDPHAPGHYLNYDLIYPEGFGEGLSGAEREHDYKTIINKIQKTGLNEAHYEPYLKTAEKGLVASAGGGFGVERLVRFLAGAKHVGDVQLFRRVPGEKIAV